MSETMATPEPQTYAEVLVPDSIEPVYGWKALKILADGRLASPQQGTIWPVKKKLLATCTNGSRRKNFGWKAVYGEPKPAPTEVGTNFSTGGATSAVVTATAVSSTGFTASGTMIVSPIDPPKTILPTGMNWSWEEIPHEIASNDCSCGIYVVNDPRACGSYLSKDCILAEVCLWGRVVPGSEGARGEFAYPRQLFSPDTLTDVATLVADLYGLPIGYRDHKTGATISHRQAMENLAAMKAKIGADPFEQGKTPMRKPQKQIVSVTPTSVTPLMQPGPVLTPPAQIAPPPPSQLSPALVQQAVTVDDDHRARQSEVNEKIIYVLSWVTLLLLWLCSLLFSPYFLVGVLPILFTQDRARRR